jgi:hypothetical protein
MVTIFFKEVISFAAPFRYDESGGLVPCVKIRKRAHRDVALTQIGNDTRGAVVERDGHDHLRQQLLLAVVGERLGLGGNFSDVVVKRHFDFLQASGGEGFVEDGFEQPVAFGPGGGELHFQPVAHRHQFIYFRHDAVLFGEGRERYGRLLDRPNI